MTNKTLTLTLAGIIIVLLTYIVVQTPKVKAWEELTQALTQIEELNNLIKDEQEKYSSAEFAKNECEESFYKKMEQAHNKADEYRNEIKKLEGFIKSRTAQ